MVVFNYSGKEVSAKVVYYGPGLSGKTTNLEWIYGKVPETQRGKMVSMKTKTDRTLFFDFLPLSAGEINGFRTRFLLYTVPGQVYYNATRKLVLKGADGVVFVADSDPQLRQANKESWANLEKNLSEYGTGVEQMPIVLQYNKRDLPQALPLEELNSDLNPRGLLVVPAVALRGDGVFETFKEITRLVFQKMHDRFEKPGSTRSSSMPPMPSTHEAEGPRTDRRAASAGPIASPSQVTRPAAAARASADDVIHLSTIDQILAARKPSAAASKTESETAETSATPPHAQTLVAPAPPQPTVAVAPPAPAAHVATPAPRSSPTPAASTDLIMMDPVAPDAGGSIVEHHVRVPVTIPGVGAGRIRLVLDIDIA